LTALNDAVMVSGAIGGVVYGYFFGPQIYSFKDLSGAFTHPLLLLPLTFTSYQGIGLKKITVMMRTEKTEHVIGADGVVIPIYIPGNDGSIIVSCQQNSQAHKTLLNWYKLVRAAIDGGDVSNFATGAMTIRSVSAGTGHVANGISIPKLGDKPYAIQAGDVEWNLPCANIQHN